MMLPNWLAPLLAAPFVGSFLGVLICRLPAGAPVALARSRCAACGRVLRPAELVPLLSFAVLRGRCRGCGAAIGWFHPAVEGAAVMVAISATAAGCAGWQLWAGCTLGWTLLALAWIDWRHLLLPDILTLPLLLAGLAASWWQGTAISAMAGAVLGWLALWGTAALYRRLRGAEGLGGGDARLLAAGGAWLGPAPLPWVVLLAALLGIALALSGRRGTPGAVLAVPFGPPLAVAIWLAWLFPASFGGV